MCVLFLRISIFQGPRGVLATCWVVLGGIGASGGLLERVLGRLGGVLGVSGGVWGVAGVSGRIPWNLRAASPWGVGEGAFDGRAGVFVFFCPCSSPNGAKTQYCRSTCVFEKSSCSGWFLILIYWRLEQRARDMPAAAGVVAGCSRYVSRS